MGLRATGLAQQMLISIRHSGWGHDMMRLRNSFVLIAALFLTTAICNADNYSFSFTGDFQHDNDVQFFSFTVLEEEIITLRTFGYDGGTNSHGQLIPGGGFDPVLELFADSVPALGPSGEGLLLHIEDAGLDCPPSSACNDVLLIADLLPGSYYLALTQYDNCLIGTSGCFADQFALNSGNLHLSNGFIHVKDGNADFTGGPFLDIYSTGTQRTGHWAMDITAVDKFGSPIPEPSSILLIGSGALGFFGTIRRRLYR